MIFIAKDFEIQSGFNKYIWIQILPILSYLLIYIYIYIYNAIVVISNGMLLFQ